MRQGSLPTPLPLANVFSIGDLLIVLGTGYAAGRIMGTRWSAPWDPAGGVAAPREAAQPAGSS